MADIIAFGDCNTLGIKENLHNAYPERIADKLHKSLKNCGYTMSTTREMEYFYNDFYTEDTEIILLQYGLVDSWKTFKYAPYVLYYPDSKIRKIFRKIVKKYKKIAKKIGLNKILGVSNVVSLEEYKNNIESLIQQSQSCTIFLVDTIPNLDISRNSEIMKYNQVLFRLSQEYTHVHFVDVYNDFVNKPEYYLDNTHMNELGYEVITQKILSIYCQVEKKNKNT